MWTPSLDRSHRTDLPSNVVRALPRPKDSIPYYCMPVKAQCTMWHVPMTSGWSELGRSWTNSSGPDSFYHRHRLILARGRPGPFYPAERSRFVVPGAVLCRSASRPVQSGRSWTVLYCRGHPELPSGPGPIRRPTSPADQVDRQRRPIRQSAGIAYGLGTVQPINCPRGARLADCPAGRRMRIGAHGSAYLVDQYSVVKVQSDPCSLLLDSVDQPRE